MWGKPMKTAKPMFNSKSLFTKKNKVNSKSLFTKKVTVNPPKIFKHKPTPKFSLFKKRNVGDGRMPFTNQMPITRPITKTIIYPTRKEKMNVMGDGKKYTVYPDKSEYEAGDLDEVKSIKGKLKERGEKEIGHYEKEEN